MDENENSSSDETPAKDSKQSPLGVPVTVRFKDVDLLSTGGYSNRQVGFESVEMEFPAETTLEEFIDTVKRVGKAAESVLHAQRWNVAKAKDAGSYEPWKERK